MGIFHVQFPLSAVERYAMFVQDLEVGEGGAIFKGDVFRWSRNGQEIIHTLPETFVRDHDGQVFNKSFWYDDLVVYIERFSRRGLNLYINSDRIFFSNSLLYLGDEPGESFYCYLRKAG